MEYACFPRVRVYLTSFAKVSVVLPVVATIRRTSRGAYAPIRRPAGDGKHHTKVSGRNPVSAANTKTPSAPRFQTINNCSIATKAFRAKSFD